MPQTVRMDDLDRYITEISVFQQKKITKIYDELSDVQSRIRSFQKQSSELYDTLD